MARGHWALFLLFLRLCLVLLFHQELSGVKTGCSLSTRNRSREVSQEGKGFVSMYSSVAGGLGLESASQLCVLGRAFSSAWQRGGHTALAPSCSWEGPSTGPDTWSCPVDAEGHVHGGDTPSGEEQSMGYGGLRGWPYLMPPPGRGQRDIHVWWD